MANYVQGAGTKRLPKVLFFTVGMTPTEEEWKASEKYRPNVGMRNGAQVAAMPMDPLEECDAVAGTVPPRYNAVYPNVSDFKPTENNVMLRMSDLDRFLGNVSDVDNEAKRGAKPPSIGQELVLAQGAPRPAGGITQDAGGFVAPRPSDPNNLPYSGGERTVNAPQGGPAQGPASNPHSLPDAGVAVLPEAQSSDTTVAPVTGSAGGAFTAPKPATSAKAEAAKK